MFYVLPLAALLGLLPAFIARAKGYPFLLWWVFGALVFIVALPVAFFLQDRRKVAIVNRMEDRLRG